MALGIVGIKRGMTRIYTSGGDSIPVTVIEAAANRVVAVREPERHGYRAVQLTWGSQAPARLNRPVAGVYEATGVAPGAGLREFRLAAGEEQPAAGNECTLALFSEGQWVDVRGVTRGRGFSGVVRRHGFSRGDSSHGNSKAHRKPGSIGQCQTPGRVYKGKKMAGHYGNVRRTVQNLKVVKIDLERSLLMLNGAVPGAQGGYVELRPAVKRRGQQGQAVAGG